MVPISTIDSNNCLLEHCHIVKNPRYYLELDSKISTRKISYERKSILEYIGDETSLNVGPNTFGYG